MVPALPRQPSERPSPMPAGTHLTGMCTKPGVAGGLALLGALHRSPLACISLKGLAAQGGFQAAYLCVSDVLRVKGLKGLLLVASRCGSRWGLLGSIPTP